MNYKRKNHHGATRRNDDTSWSNPLTIGKKTNSEARTFRKLGKPKVCKATKGKHLFKLVEYHKSLFGKQEWWVNYICACGKKDLKFEDEEPVLAS